MNLLIEAESEKVALQMLDSCRAGMAMSKQRLSSRVVWFGAGAALNYALIAMPFKWFASHTHWPLWATSACSVAVGTAFLFAWNVLVNFRSEGGVGVVLPRYIAAVVAMWLLSSALLTALKHVDFGLPSKVGAVPLDFDVIGTQCVLAGLKFTLYHKWVFRQ